MSIVLYLNESGELAQRLQKIIKGLSPEDSMESFQEIDLLIEKFRREDLLETLTRTPTISKQHSYRPSSRPVPVSPAIYCRF